MKRQIVILTLVLLILMGCSNNEVNGDGALVNQNGDAISDSQEMLSLEGFTVIEVFSYWDNRIEGGEEITLEAAAEIGAQYILDVFGVELDGKYVQLMYNYNPHISHGLWEGFVVNERSDLEGDFLEIWTRSLFVFRIDAMTGERIEIHNINIEPLHGITLFDQWEMDEEELIRVFPEPDEEEIETTLEIARDFAERHFSQGSLASIEYGFYVEGSDFDYHPAPNLTFVARDETGRAIEITIQRETGLLLYMIVPFEHMFGDVLF